MSVKRLHEDLSAIGLENGDRVLVRASVRAIGVADQPAQKLLQALLDAVGEDGTLLSLSYTPFVRTPFGRPPNEMVFHERAPTYAGALPQLMLDDPRSLRSRHPTCSVVAIGKDAAKFVDGHDHSAAAYLPIQRLVDCNGKMLLIGCVSSSPGFTTAHLAEQSLGMGWRYIWPSANKCYFLTDDNKKAIFRRPDPGFCSQSFTKFYSLYVSEQVLRAGFVGGAYSIQVPAQKAFQIESAALKKNPKFNVCDDANCRLCNTQRWDRLHRVAIFFGQRLVRRLARAVRRRLSFGSS